MRVGEIYVPSEGPDRADIMIVGEAPGADEEEKHRPFVGRAGTILMNALEHFRLQRKEVFLTNLCKHRPAKNKFENLLGTPELAAGLEELKTEIENVRPNVIMAAGAWPNYFLTGKTGARSKAGTGISNWRGSVVPCTLVPGGPKVAITYHPAFIARVPSVTPIFLFDMRRRVVEQSTFPELIYPSYEAIINPDPDTLARVVSELLAAPIISVDIETFGPGRMSCIGFADSHSRGLCITFEQTGGSEPSFWEDSEAGHLARTLYESPVPKCFQFGTYDVNFLSRFFGWRVGGFGGEQVPGFDTYIAAATLMPSFPRGLDFLTSIYTDFPYYKEERKVWKTDGDMQSLWEYNVKDIIATFTIMERQQAELKEIFV